MQSLLYLGVKNTEVPQWVYEEIFLMIFLN